MRVELTTRRSIKPRLQQHRGSDLVDDLTAGTSLHISLHEVGVGGGGSESFVEQFDWDRQHSSQHLDLVGDQVSCFSKLPVEADWKTDDDADRLALVDGQLSNGLMVFLLAARPKEHLKWRSQHLGGIGAGDADPL